MANDRSLPLGKMERGTVARGRTIEVPDTTQSTTVGFTDDGKPVKRAGRKFFGPGREVELASEEIRALRERGFLIDPDRTEPPLAEGPNFKETGTTPATA